jgi:hypothetical protein
VISPTQVAAVWTERKRDQGTAVDRMQELADAYGSKIDLAVSELYRNERPAAANLLYVNLHQYAMRVAGPDPTVICPPLRSGFKGSEQRADLRRRVTYGWFEQNDMAQVRLQRAMWLLAFTSSPVVIRPSSTLGGPMWEPKDPRRFFPSDTGLQPHDAVGTSERSWGWLQNRYAADPDVLARLAALHKEGQRRGGGQGWDHDKRVTLLEWWDADCCMVVALGDTAEPGPDRLAVEQRACVIESYPNLAGVTPVACPTPVSLDPDEPRSQFDGMLGSYQMRSRLMSLSYLAVERGIFAEEWAVPMTGTTEAVIKQVPIPRQGQVGIIEGGTIQRMPPDPEYASGQLMDRLEYNERQGGSAPPEFGGAGATNVRTGRRGGQVMGATVDEYIATYQLRLAQSLAVEIDIAARIDRAYFGGRDKELFVTLKGAQGAVKYRPEEVWETTTVKIRYPFAGVDISNLTLEAGQLVGLEAYSRRSLMEIHPLVSDVEEEEDRITSEQIERAFFANLMAMAADPASPVTMSMLSKLRQLILSDRVEWWTAWDMVQQEAEEAQAAIQAGQMQAPMPGVDGGLVPPGPVAEPAATMPGMQELGSMLMATRGPQMTVAGERAA